MQQAPPGYVIAHVKLTVSGVDLETKIPVPKAPVRARELLPIFRAFAGAFENTAVEAVGEIGRAVSCRKGCGACCRQLVPVAQCEVYMLRDLVEGFTEPHRSVIKQRFAEAIARVEAAGLRERLSEPGRHSEEEAKVLADEYFALGIPCPFLEEESCSIHPERPIRCREYLVTTPAEKCVYPAGDDVKTVPLPAKTSVPVMRLDDDSAHPYLRWVPLIFALEFAEAHAERGAEPGTELFTRFLKNVGKEPEYAK